MDIFINYYIFGCICLYTYKYRYICICINIHMHTYPNDVYLYNTCIRVSDDICIYDYIYRLCLYMHKYIDYMDIC